MELEEKRRRLKEHQGDAHDENSRSSLPEVIVVYEILPWIPIKALCRFKLVSKKWCNVISADPNFKGLQSRRCLSLPPAVLYFKRANNVPWNGPNMVSMPDPSLKYTNIGNGLLRSSSNGLICGCLSRERYYYVSNPITRERVAIPQSSAFSDVAIAFEVVNSNPSFVLVSRHSEMISLSGSKTETEIGFTIYSSKTGMWSRANAKVRTSKWYGSYLINFRSVFTGGKLYWELGKEVLWFDIMKDDAGVVSVPNEAERIPEGLIGNYNGELSYSMLSTKTLNIEIWLLTSGSLENEFKWVKKYCLDLRSILEKKGISHGFNSIKRRYIQGYIRVLPFEGGDVVMFWVWCIDGIGKHIIFLYNIKSGSLKHVSDSGMESCDILISYKPSLASIPRIRNLHQV